MRKFFFFFALFLVGCAGSGDDGSGATSSSAVAHKPEITGFTLSPDTATQMDGEGISQDEIDAMFG